MRPPGSPGPATCATAAAPAGVIRYFDHVLPLAPGSLDGVDAADVAAVLERQHWAPMFWRREDTELNYRRFFTITSLAGVRVEVPWVFDASHAEVLRWLREGLVDGLRIDHPDGLADPGAYLARLAGSGAVALSRREGAGAAGDDADPAPYIVVEKILEHAATDRPEPLPPWWATEGTTGYDAMAEIDRVLVDPDGEPALDALDAHLRASSGLAPLTSYADLIHDTKRTVADTIQHAEVLRIVRCLPRELGMTDETAIDALAELLACFPVYRSYLPAGADALAHASAAASARRPDLAEPLQRLTSAVLGDPDEEAARRFQQTTGPVMAKGVEDTAFYRYTRLGSLTEVGGDPSVFALPVEGFHRAQERRQSAWPQAMTALSTHDTKRAEDVRARLAVLAEIPDRWAEVLESLRAIASTGHGPFDNLLYQAVVGAWPATPERLHAYAEKAAREAAEATGWRDHDAAFEARVHALIDAAFGPDAAPVLEAFHTEIAPRGWSNSLAAKLLQLAGPGVPDVYQGSELWDHSLVDPDNRRAVSFAERMRMLAALDADPARVPAVDASGAAKLLVVSRALRLRRDRPGLFTRYTPMTAVGDASDHVIAFDRGGALAVATRLPVRLAARGGWGDTVLLRHAGPTVDVLTGRRFSGSELPLADLLRDLPVALLATA